MIDERFTIIGSVIAMIGGLSYLIATIKGEVKPNKVSFLMWSFAPLIAFAAQIKEGVGFFLALITLVAGIEPLSIFIASFFNKNAKWKINKFDIFCGAMSILGLIPWQITKTINIAIFFSILADGMASLPTLIKSFKNPETEMAWTYFTTVISAVITLLAVKEYTFASIGFTVYLLVVCLAITLLVQFKIGKLFTRS